MHDPTPAGWRKSSYSGSGNACVEVADVPDGAADRDSKDPAAPALTFPAAGWSTFTAGVRAGEFD